MQQPRCTTCPRPVPDTAYGCADCAATLAHRLDQLAAVLPEIGTTVAKLDRITAGGARPQGAEEPLPYNPAASDKGRAIQGELVTWARHVHAETGREIPAATGSALATYLAQAADWARYRQEWPEFHAALRGLLGATLHLVDRPADKVYLGPCRTRSEQPGPCPVDCACHCGPHYACSEPGGCGSAGCGRPTGEECTADVMAKPGAAFGRCRACGTQHDVAKSREWLLRSLQGVLARPVEIAGVLRGFGHARVGYSTIAAYAANGLIAAKGEDGHGRPLYRIGDVLDVHARLARRKTHQPEVIAS